MPVGNCVEKKRHKMFRGVALKHNEYTKNPFLLINKEKADYDLRVLHSPSRISIDL